VYKHAGPAGSHTPPPPCRPPQARNTFAGDPPGFARFYEQQLEALRWVQRPCRILTARTAVLQRPYSGSLTAAVLQRQSLYSGGITAALRWFTARQQPCVSIEASQQRRLWNERGGRAQARAQAALPLAERPEAFMQVRGPACAPGGSRTPHRVNTMMK
jgi:hypothetical protein